MVLRRNDARRRRLVIDPTVQSGDANMEVRRTSSASPVRRQAVQPEARTYSYGADRRNQRKTTDLIPKRVVSYLLVVLALLTCLWAINFTSVRADQWVGLIGQAGLDALAIRGQGSLASWFSSFLLIMTGLACLQVYALRQHRCDDYRGTYRLWLWLAAMMIIASINCVTNLGTVATNLIQSMISGTQVPRPWVPLALKLVALSVLIGRVIFEVRQSRGAFALVLFVWGAYSLVAVLQFPAVQESMVGMGANTLIGNSVLFGTTALFLAHLTYARYIFLDAHGLIVQRIKTEKVVKVKQAKVAKPKTTPNNKVAKTNRNSSSKKKAPVAAADTTVENPRVSKPKLSKPKVSAQPRKTAKPKSVRKTTSAQPKPANSQADKNAKSPSDVLRDLAAASRAKEHSQQQSPQSIDFQEDHSESGFPSTKAQRRKQRKLEKQRRLAA